MTGDAVALLWDIRVARLTLGRMRQGSDAGIRRVIDADPGTGLVALDLDPLFEADPFAVLSGVTGQVAAPFDHDVGRRLRAGLDPRRPGFGAERRPASRRRGSAVPDHHDGPAPMADGWIASSPRTGGEATLLRLSPRSVGGDGPERQARRDDGVPSGQRRSVDLDRWMLEPRTEGPKGSPSGDRRDTGAWPDGAPPGEMAIPSGDDPGQVPDAAGARPRAIPSDVGDPLPTGRWVDEAAPSASGDRLDAAVANEPGPWLGFPTFVPGWAGDPAMTWDEPEPGDDPSGTHDGGLGPTETAQPAWREAMSPGRSRDDGTVVDLEALIDSIGRALAEEARRSGVDLS